MAEIKNRIIGSGEEPLDSILFNPRNWRIHPLNQQDALKGVLEEVGWVQQVIINKRTGNLIDGHLRCQLAAREGNKTIPVLYVDIDEAEEELVLATLDPIAGLAATDKAKLEELFAGIQVENEFVGNLIEEIAEKEHLGELGKLYKLNNFTVLRRPTTLCGYLGCFSACRWKVGKSDDYNKFLAWKDDPSANSKITNEMACDIANVIICWSRSWRGFIITAPPQGASYFAGKEYAAGILAKEVANILGVDYVTLFEPFNKTSPSHHPMESIKQQVPPKLIIDIDKPVIVIDDMLSSGNTMKLTLKALEPRACWFFTWINNQQRSIKARDMSELDDWRVERGQRALHN